MEEVKAFVFPEFVQIALSLNSVPISHTLACGHRDGK